MSEDPAFQIRAPAVRIDDAPVDVFGHGVDGHVAAFEIGLQGHLGRSMEHEPLVTGPHLAFGARERVFLVGLGMEKDREVLADRAIT